jgi:hypothetical protein
MRKALLVAIVLLVLPAVSAEPPSPTVLVICAPGYPGTTAQARPVMDTFAAAAARAAGWPAGGLSAVYHEREEPGLARLAQDDAALALVPLPFYLKHGPSLGLAPRLEVVRESGATESFSLVARSGAIPSVAALEGFEVVGAPCYAPAFVRGPVLGPWGALPSSTTVRFSPSILSALRRAAAGERIAALLDAAQSTALASLPLAAKLETVYRAKPLPGTLLCTVRDRAKGRRFEALLEALPGLHKTSEGADALKAMQMVRFEAADLAGIEAARKAYAAAEASPR